MSGLRIEYHNPNELKPYENNARDHKEEDIGAIRESIRQFGFNDPIGIWSDENLIVEGHGRQLAAIAEGLDSVPCIRLDHLTDEQRRAYALAHNKTAELSAWDFNTLDLELAGIEEIDMSAFGFEDGISDEFGTDFQLDDGEKSSIVTWSFTLHEEQRDLIKMALESIDPVDEFGNPNKMGNALYEVVREWAEQKMLL